MHRTPRVALICVLSGEIWLERDAEEVHLREGKFGAERNQTHARRNNADRPCRMAVALVGAGPR